MLKTNATNNAQPTQKSFVKYHVTALGAEWENGRKRETKKDVVWYLVGVSFGDDKRVSSIRRSREAARAGRFSERMANKIVAEIGHKYSKLAIIEAV